jgi:hypothetical protein
MFGSAKQCGRGQILVLLMFSGSLLKAGTIGLIKHFNQMHHTQSPSRIAASSAGPQPTESERIAQDRSGAADSNGF